MSVTLFHNAMSTCSQKVRLALAEKGVDWDSREINLLASEQKAPDYLALNPKGVVPTLVVDSAAIIESTLINEFIEDAFPEPSLLPAQAVERARARLWAKRIDDNVHAACGALTFGTVMRAFQMTRPREAVLADLNAMHDPVHRAVRLSLFEYGVNAPEFANSVRAMTGLFSDMDSALSAHEWLAGSDFSLADCAAAPYASRFEQFGLAESWEAERPNLHRWYRALKVRPSYEVAFTRWESQAALKNFAAAGQQILPLLAA